jgi:hypothetical protein
MLVQKAQRKRALGCRPKVTVIGSSSVRRLPSTQEADDVADQAFDLADTSKTYLLSRTLLLLFLL